MANGIRIFSAGPLSVLAVILIIGIVIILIPLFLLGLIGAAFTRLGFSWVTALAVVLLMIFGSFINIPVYRFQRDTIRIDQQENALYGGGSAWESVISVNLGGAIMPLIISLYLIYTAFPMYGQSLLFSTGIGLVIVAVIAFVSTRQVPVTGLSVSLILPALAALLMGSLLGGGTGISSVVIAFVSGTMGTLLGGNIAYLVRIKEMGIPFLNIGGAGTFGAIFLCCLLPALIA
jgi:uncharacterized membrane protein